MIGSKLPLQTGSNALARVALVAAPMAVGLAVLGGPRGSGDGAATFSFMYVYFLPFVAIALMGAVGRTRASDVELWPDELKVDGGHHDGLRLRWSMIERASVDDGWLALSLGDGVTLKLARATGAGELRSLTALADVIASECARVRHEGDAPAPLPPSVVQCPECGAPACVDDAPSVPCDACGADVAVPNDVRARVAQARERRRGRVVSERATRALMEQPAARTVNLRLVVLAVLGFAWLPLAARTAGFSPTVLVSLAVFAAFALALRVVIANRRALSVVFLELGAARHAGVDACRACGGPLPRHEPTEVVVACVYCDTENVLGAPIHARRPRARDDARTLDVALADRARSIRSAATVGLMGIAAICIALTAALRR